MGVSELEVELFRSILGAFADHYLVVDASGTVLARFGGPDGPTQHDVPTGRTLTDDCPDAAGEVILSAVRRCMETGEAQHGSFARDERRFDVRVAPLRHGALVVCRDVSECQAVSEERDRIEADSIRFQRYENAGRLAGAVAHDFNNLLGTILGGATVARSKVGDGHPAVPALDRIHEAVQAAADLTRQLATFAGRGAAAATGALDLSAHLAGIDALVRAALPKGMVLHVSLDANLPKVQADGALVHQAVMNLVFNGAQAQPGGGSLTLRTAVCELTEADITRFAGGDLLPGTYVVVEVADEGTGIDPAIQPRVFDAFFTTRPGRRGLGLCATRGVMRSHQGAVELVSRPGSGTVARLFFPAVAEGATSAARAGSDRSRATGTILVVDDEEALREVVSEMLDLLGYSTLQAASGSQALKVYAAHAGTVEAVLLDLMMPGMSGEQTARGLRELDPEVPILLTSGYHQIEVLRRIGVAGQVDVLKKPFELGELRACLERLRS